MKSQYQKNKISERLELLAISELRDGSGWCATDAMLQDANKAYSYGFSQQEIMDIVNKAYDYLVK